MIAPLLNHLNSEDDPNLWQVVMDTILLDLEPVKGMTAEIGRCSHWMRPHQTRWTADGGFAAPIGYHHGTPEFDWSIILEWTGQEWIAATDKGAKPVLRVAIPSRSTRHNQAAVHTLWRTGKENKSRPYGFRKKNDLWQLTAAGFARDNDRSRHDANNRAKARKLQRRQSSRRL